MSFNKLPKWDINRPIYFKLGMVIALSIANIAINYETTPPDYAEYTLEDSFGYAAYNEIYHHREEVVKRDPPKSVNPVIAKIIPVVQPILEQIKLQETSLLNLTSENSMNLGLNGPISELIKVVPKPDDPESKKVWTITEVMPCLLECDSILKEEDRKVCTQKTILNFIHKNLKYPPLAREEGIEGTVIISFVIDKKGDIRDFEILRDIGAGCGEAALKSIKMLPKWRPGRQNQKAVNVKYVFPIKFKLDH